MSKELTKEDVIQNKKEAIKSLNGLLESYINEPSGNHLKKANLLAYWLKDYVKMINFEEKFEPTRNISYKRGNVVKLNFGFNIGCEYGGLHYGIVLDLDNEHNSPVVTVIPLTSVKESKTVHPNSVELGNELYRNLKLKYDTISKSLKEEQEQIIQTKKAFIVLTKLAGETLSKAKEQMDATVQFEELSKVKEYLDTTDKLEEFWTKREQHIAEQLEYLNKIGEEISKMKEGSIALVNQITTISKLRIFDPRNLKGVLAGISLSPETMDKINDKIKELYVF